jgi:hypothetical protein
MSTPNKPMNIHNIRIDGGTQSRVAINQEAVAEYAAVLKDGDYLPEVVVFFDGVENWLADGFHRFHAHLAAGKASIVVDKRKGTQRDAILYSLNANTVHGLRPTNDDKRKAVLTMLTDAEWSEMSERAIARHCGVSHTFVSNLKTPPATGNVATPDGENTGNVATQSAASSGNVATSKGSATGNVATKTVSQSQAQADQNAEDAHGDSDPIAMLEEAEKRIAALQQELFAVEADDLKAETLKWKRVADVATRRQNELMDTVNAREKELQRQANWLKRIGTALGEEDNSKLAAKVEALARANRK